MNQIDNLSANQSNKLRHLETSLGISAGDIASLSNGHRSAICASLQREVDIQYKFMIIYQALVLILATVVLGLLVFAAWKLVGGTGAMQSIVSGAGALVAGAAANFLLNQRTDARDAHKAALAGKSKHCPHE